MKARQPQTGVHMPTVAEVEASGEAVDWFEDFEENIVTVYRYKGKDWIVFYNPEVDVYSIEAA
jgi:hypothetical protein